MLRGRQVSEDALDVLTPLYTVAVPDYFGFLMVQVLPPKQAHQPVAKAMSSRHTHTGSPLPSAFPLCERVRRALTLCERPSPLMPNRCSFSMGRQRIGPGHFPALQQTREAARVPAWSAARGHFSMLAVRANFTRSGSSLARVSAALAAPAAPAAQAATHGRRSSIPHAPLGLSGLCPCTNNSAGRTSARPQWLGLLSHRPWLPLLLCGVCVESASFLTFTGLNSR